MKSRHRRLLLFPMKFGSFFPLAVIALILTTAVAPLVAAGPDLSDAPMPQGVKAVWELGRAWHEETPSRQRICVNGLWRWQPADGSAERDGVPTGGWGYFKVPGSWPGISDYLQQDSQALYPNPAWKSRKLGEVSAAWYQREIEVPAGWGERRITLSADYLNSFAAVYIDGKKIGEMRFPAGEVDLTATCRPGSRHVLSMLVIALPLKGVRVSYSDTAAAREVKGSVPRRGLCGDVYLIGAPAGPRVGEVKVRTSVRKSEITFDVRLEGLEPNKQYSLRANVTDGGKPISAFVVNPFKVSDLADGRFVSSVPWDPGRHWDLNSPGNLYQLDLSLLDDKANVLDTSWRQPFGFREFWIDGRDFYLNGTRIFLSAVPLDNAQLGAAWANYAAARETFARLKSIGVNCVYTHNYDCEPGAHLSFEEILRAADDTGMLVSLTQPHFSGYDWKSPDADQSNGYARDAAFYARVAGNHPSVVLYAMSHNATGYDGDMDPDLIDGIHDRRDKWSANNAKLALRAEAIVHKLDPGRSVYHHAGGNIGSMHTVNFYPNFAPTQELSDWFAHWAEAGIKPVFLCEYAAPMTWDWTMYRGWYQGKREFGSAAVPWEFCLAEWNSQFLGDRAFAMRDAEKANLRWEAKQFEAGRLWHRWDYPTAVGSARFDDRNDVLAEYLTDNWRAYRTWGVSGISPWDYEIYWTPRPGVDRGRKELKVNWDDLQRPGLSADYIDRQTERVDVAFERADWIPTAAGKALLRNNQPQLAYIAGNADAFTSKDHNFRPGEVVEKQLMLINNSRTPLAFRCEWSLALPTPVKGSREVSVETGQQARIPLRFELPADLPPGRYDLRATARFGDGEDDEQADTFVIDVTSPTLSVPTAAKIALFDPKGETATLLEKLGVKCRRIEAVADLSADEILVIGKLALTLDGPAPDVSRVRDGLKVIVFEQSSRVLEKRLGFRVTEYGLRQVFERIPDHPALASITPEQLSNWRGEATTMPPRLTAESVPQHGPTINWCGIPVSRVWRCGNRGNVASVPVEKPARGDFRPILDGGFDLQFAPLMEYREGKGLVLFCQMDVTGRTETDPIAQTLVANLLRYVSVWKADPVRRAVYAGEQAGRDHLKSCGVEVASYDGGELSPREQVLIVGPGGGKQIAPHTDAVGEFLKHGGPVLAIALDQDEANVALPFNMKMARREHLSAVFDPPVMRSLLAGVGPADVSSRAPLEIPLVASGATVVGDGVLALSPADAPAPAVVFFQIAPWQLDYKNAYDLKRTYRRASFTLTRLLANMGVAGSTPLLDRISTPDGAVESGKRWLEGLYLDTPEEWDDPYRFFRW
jgi:beta-galactosidase